MRIIVVALLMLMSGCVATGTTIKTPKEGIAACYFTVRTAFTSAADLRSRGQLSDSARDQVLSVGEKALTTCDAARLSLAGGDVSTAQGQLQAAQLILLQLETLLKEKQK